MRTGVTLQGVDEPATFCELVDRIDALGYDDIFLTDSSLHARNCYAYLTLAALRSPRLRLGTAVTNPLTRHPGITASAAATVDEISNGRFVLGIGCGDRPLHALGLRPAPLATLRESIGAIRGLLAGNTVTTNARGFALNGAQLRFHVRPDIPIYIAASGPKTLELAGEIADGVILLAGLFEAGVRWAIERIEAGSARAGRHRPAVMVFAYGAIDDDLDRALDSARSIAAWFPQTAPHYCELAGLDREIAAEVRSSYSGGELQEAVAAGQRLPVGFVQRMALAGDVEHAVAHLRTLRAIGVDAVSVFPLGPRRIETIESFAQAVHAAEEASP